MTTAVAVRQPTLPGLLPNVEALALARSFRTEMDGAVIVIDRMPTIVERERLSRRSAEMEQALAPVAERNADRVTAAEVIAGLLLGWRVCREDPRSAETITTYVKHLSPMPLFAIKAACDDVEAGRVFDVDRRTGNRIPLDPDYPVSSIRLRQVAQKHVDSMRAEKWLFDRALMAKRALPAPISEAERERMRGKFAALMLDLGARDLGGALQQLDHHVRARNEERRRLHTERMLLADYERLGIEPVRSTNGFVVSIDLMLSQGWRIEELSFGGQISRSLVSPTGVRNLDDRLDR